METLFKKIKKDHFEKLRNVILHSEKYHLEGDTWTHTCLVFSKANDDFNKIVGLLHDLGKPNAKTHKDGKDYYRGHEGISTFEALEYIDDIERILGKDKILDVLYTINYHGMLWQKSEKQIKHYFAKNIDKYLKIYNFSLFDKAGNIFFDNENNRKAKECIVDFKDIKRGVKKNKCYIMIGTPLSGKSTYIKENLPNLKVLSRDNILMNYIKEKFICNFCNGKGYIEGYVGDNLDHSICNKCKGKGYPTYSDGWNMLTEDDHKEIDRRVSKKFTELKNSNEDFIIDMTNMTWKSRRKWLTNLKNHSPIAITLLTPIKELFFRNKYRFETEGKFIPENVLYNMMKNLEMPLGYEFDEIKIIINKKEI